MGTAKHTNEVKIIIYGLHFAWLEKEYINTLDGFVKNRTDWIREECYDEFGIEINSKEDMWDFELKLKSCLYKDKADWLRDKIRHLYKRSKNFRPKRET